MSRAPIWFRERPGEPDGMLAASVLRGDVIITPCQEMGENGAVILVVRHPDEVAWEPALGRFGLRSTDFARGSRSCSRTDRCGFVVRRGARLQCGAPSDSARLPSTSSLWGTATSLSVADGAV